MYALFPLICGFSLFGNQPLADTVGVGTVQYLNPLLVNTACDPSGGCHNLVLVISPIRRNSWIPLKLFV